MGSVSLLNDLVIVEVINCMAKESYLFLLHDITYHHTILTTKYYTL